MTLYKYFISALMIIANFICIDSQHSDSTKLFYKLFIINSDSINNNKIIFIDGKTIYSFKDGNYQFQKIDSVPPQILSNEEFTKIHFWTDDDDLELQNQLEVKEILHKMKTNNISDTVIQLLRNYFNYHSEYYIVEKNEIDNKLRLVKVTRQFKNQP